MHEHTAEAPKTLRARALVRARALTATAPGPPSPRAAQDLSNIVFVDNMPIVPEAKVAKLRDWARDKIFSKVRPRAGARAGPPRPRRAPRPHASPTHPPARPPPRPRPPLPPQVGDVAPDGVNMPVDPVSKETLGYCFVSYATPEAATRAVAGLDKIEFDKTHRLAVTRFDEVQALRRGDAPRRAERVEPGAAEDDAYWLLDDQCRDEFVLRYSNTEKDRAEEAEKHETEVCWANTRGAPALDYGGERHKASGRYWADRHVAWSPRGTFLTTMHKPGAKLWHGKGFRDGFRLLHDDVHDVLWSPDERYVCTWNGYPNNARPERAFVVWDARTGLEVRKFKQAEQADAAHKFAWSADGRFLARIVTEVSPTGGAVELIHIHEAPTFRLLEDRSVKAPGARELAWCPRKHNILSWWSPERENLPTAISMLRVPSKEFIKPRLLSNVQDVRIVWAPGGDYCAIFAEKLTRGQMAKKKKAGGGKVVEPTGGGGVAIGGPSKLASAGYTVEILRFRSKDVPVDVIEIKERVLQFAWEPAAARFALLTGEGSKCAVQFYALGEKQGITETHRLDNQAVSALHWSPRGEHLLMTGLGMSLGGALFFYDAGARRIVAEAAHEPANGVLWDPSGRLVASVKTRALGGNLHPREAVGNGFILWTFQGARVAAADKPKLFQFAWRPRPDALLSDDEAREVARNLKKFVQRYQDEDKARLTRKALLARLRKRKALDEHRAFVAERSIEWGENRPMREALGLVPAAGEGSEGRDSDLVTEERFEILLSETVTVVE